MLAAPLTERQLALLRFMHAHLIERGHPPTYDEIMAHFGFRSKNAVACHLYYLENKGAIVVDKFKSRALTFTAGGLIALGLPVVSEAPCRACERPVKHTLVEQKQPRGGVPTSTWRAAEHGCLA